MSTCSWEEGNSGPANQVTVRWPKGASPPSKTERAAELSAHPLGQASSKLYFVDPPLGFGDGERTFKKAGWVTFQLTEELGSPLPCGRCPGTDLPTHSCEIEGALASTSKNRRREAATRQIHSFESPTNESVSPVQDKRLSVALRPPAGGAVKSFSSLQTDAVRKKAAELLSPGGDSLTPRRRLTREHSLRRDKRDTVHGPPRSAKLL